MILRVCSLAIVLVSLTAGWSNSASAQASHLSEWPEGELGFELGLHTGEKIGSRATWVAPRVHGYYRVVPNFALGWDWSFLGAIIEDTDDRFAVGNPYVSGHYLVDLDNVALSLGGGVALPLARLDDGFADAAILSAIYFGGTGMNGSMRGWQFAPEDLSLVGSIRLSARVSPTVRVLGNTELILLVPTGEADEELDVAWQISGGAMFAFQPVEIGGRLNFFWIPSVDGENTQLSVEPMVRFNAAPWYFDSRLVINLDDPYGFAFDSGRFWGLFFGATVEFR